MILMLNLTITSILLQAWELCMCRGGCMRGLVIKLQAYWPGSALCVLYEPEIFCAVRAHT